MDVIGAGDELDDVFALVEVVEAMEYDYDDEDRDLADVFNLVNLADNLVPERRQYKMMERIDMDCFDDSDFVYRFRLSKSTVMYVLQMIKSKLELIGDEQRHLRCGCLCVHVFHVSVYFSPFLDRSRHIKPLLQLLICLRFFALGSIELAVADFVGVSVSSICRIIFRVSHAIAALHNRFIKMPESEEEMRTASAQFFAIAKFPRVLGAIDHTRRR